MTYAGGRNVLEAVSEADPDCAMGYWGQAMTLIHPLWSDPRSEVEFQRGQAFVSEAKTRGKKTKRERAFLSHKALSAL